MNNSGGREALANAEGVHLWNHGVCFHGFPACMAVRFHPVILTVLKVTSAFKRLSKQSV